MISSELMVERLETYSPRDAADLGVLRKAMTSKRSDKPIAERKIRDITDRDDRVWVVGRKPHSGEIVSCATIAILPVPESDDENPEVGDIGWLGFVSTRVDERKKGFIKLVMREGFNWCLEQGIDTVKFTSNSNNTERETARLFYLKYGAAILASGVGPTDTDLFVWRVEDGIAALEARAIPQSD